MPKGKPHNPYCLKCGVLKTEDNAYKQPSGKLQSYCKSCDKKDKTERKRNQRLGMIPIKKKHKRSVVGKEWSKPNKNHYPDPEWVWTQIENNESPAAFVEKLNQKYALSTHGNKGKNNLGRKKTK